MDLNRRDFLQGTAWMGLAAAAAGCQFDCMLDEAKRRVIHEMEKYF